MATGNFFNKNASKVFAIACATEVDTLDEHGNETTEYRQPDEFEYAEEIEFIKDEIKRHPKWNDEGSDDYSRNFHRTALGVLIADKSYLDVTIEIGITAFARSGYYEGANLDWELEFFVDGYEHSDIDGAVEEWEFQVEEDNNAGLISIHKTNVENWMNNTVDNLIEELEAIFENVSQHKLRVAARFSNGEVMYETA